MFMRPNVKGGIIFEGLLIMVGIGLLIKAFVLGAAVYQFKHGADILPIPGKIMEITGHGFTASIEYELLNGQKIYFTQRGFFPRYAPGQVVPVLYDPNKTGFALVDKFDVVWFMSMVFGLPGLILLFIGTRKWMVRSL